MIHHGPWTGVLLLLGGLACGRTPGYGPQAGGAGTSRLEGVFVPRGTMTTVRVAHTATRLPSGKVLVVGGFGATAVGSTDPASAELFAPGADTFVATHAMSVGRDGHMATLLGNGQVFIAGGSSLQPAIELYSPSSAGFTSVTTRPGDWAYLTTATLLLDGRVLVAGLTDAQQSATEPRTEIDGQLYDPRTRTLTVTGSMNADRTFGTGTLLKDGRVLLAGGANLGWTSAELYDPSTGVFTPTGSMAVARWQHTATLLDDGRVLIAGGGRDQIVGVATAELYDPATGSFAITGSMTVGRSGHTATLLGDGRVLIAGGGTDGPDVVTASAELYDPASETFEVTGSMSSARARHTATQLSDGRVLVAGGVNDQREALASAETYE